MLSDDVASVLGDLQTRTYLMPGRPGEWRPGPKLNELFDQQASQTCESSIYSNIQNSDTRQIEIRDQHTRQPLARVDTRWLNRSELTLEGRSINVEWVDGEAVWVATTPTETTAVQRPYRPGRKYLAYKLTCLIPSQLGLSAGAAPLIAVPDGWCWFHWLGDVYGRVLLDLLRNRMRAAETSQPGLCLWLDDAEAFTVPVWTAAQVNRYLGDHYRSLERLLDLGPFQHLLPSALRQRAVVEQFDVLRFLEPVMHFTVHKR